MGYTSVVWLSIILTIVCFNNVLSLKCYSCFSYESKKDCESRYNLKEIDCDTKEFDTCLQLEMTVDISQIKGVKRILTRNKAYARYCGSTKSDCKQSVLTPTICNRMFSKSEAEIKVCNVTCCDTDLKSKCHEKPHWPGTQQSSSTFSDNTTYVHKGKRGSGALITVSIWFPLILGVLSRQMF